MTEGLRRRGERWRSWLAGIVVGGLLSAPTGAAGGDRLPGPDLNLRLAAPIATWDEAVPLGNGLLGGLLWGEQGTLRLSLDRGDLWDERPAPGNPLARLTYAQVVQWVREGRNADISRIVDAQAYDRKHPTKIPAGRLEIDLAADQEVAGFELNLATAEGRAALANGGRVEAFFSAAESIALLRIPGPEPRALRLMAPQSVRQLGYPEAKQGGEGDQRWFVQQAALGLEYAVVVGWRRLPDATLMAVTVSSTADGADPVDRGRARVSEALKGGYEKALGPHAKWWQSFWATSQVALPDQAILRHYYLAQYFYGAASRQGAPPIPLQGVWTADAGSLPPWKGDYHHDLNTQMTYLAYQVAGRWEAGRCFLDFLWDRLPVFRRFARDFFGTPGANVPGVMTLAGAPLGGWAQYSLSPTAAGWLAHLFYLHWRYTADDEFLRTRAYPWCAEVGESLAALLRPNASGRLVLPTSSSPEIHDNSAQAWLKPNTNYDLAILRMLFLALKEMALAQGLDAAGQQWGDLSAALGDFHVTSGGALGIDAEEALPASHRHFSNLMGLYPFNLTTIEGAAADREVIRASLAEYDRLGTKAWCGYSFAWMSALRARVGEAEEARHQQELFVRAFILRNGFHANGDQTRSGLSDFTYRPFTLEGNFLAAAAIHEMLLQSWSGRPGEGDWGSLRVFPAVPERWREVAFEDLRAEGGHRVSARREGGVTRWIRVVAGRDGPVRIRDNFGGREPSWSRSGVRRAGEDFEVGMARGEAVEASFE